LAQVIALVSLAGGTGRTTVAANLAAALQERGLRVLALDLDPANALGLHLGMSPGETWGLVNAHDTGHGINQWLAHQRPLVPYMPFGASHSQELAEMMVAATTPGWLEPLLPAWVPKDTDLVLIDTPAGNTPMVQRVVEIADLALVPLRPDAACFATLPATEALFADIRGDDESFAVRYLINRFDERRALSCDVVDALGAAVGDQMLPVVLFEDEAVRESLARGELLLNAGAGSAAARHVRKLAQLIGGDGADGDPDARRVFKSLTGGKGHRAA